MKLIDADALAKHIKDLPTWWADDGGVYPGGSMKYPDGMYYPEDIISSIDNASTVDAVELVHGRWVKHKPKPEAMRAWHRQGIGKAMSENSIFWTCSCCEEWGTPRYNYCPNCGAKMDGGNEDDL